jgi:hypothetical protein
MKLLHFGISGGTGAKPFDDSASIKDPFDMRVLAVRVRSGSRIDSIQFVYLGNDGRVVPSDVHGGNGGTEERRKNSQWPLTNTW